MSRILLAFGDSHTAGAEIEEQYNYECYSKAYPSYIAKYYGFEYENYSQAGCSNDWLLKRFNDAIKKSIINKDKIFILFNFCEATRTYIEIPTPSEFEQNWDENFYGPLHFYSQHLTKNFFINQPDNPYNKSIKKHLPVYHHYISLNNDKMLHEKALNQIFHIQSICERYNIPFLFHSSFDWYTGDWKLISKKNYYGHHSNLTTDYDVNIDAPLMSSLYSFWGVASNHPNWKNYQKESRWSGHYPEEYHKYWAARLIKFINEQKILEDCD